MVKIFWDEKQHFWELFSACARLVPHLAPQQPVVRVRGETRNFAASWSRSESWTRSRVCSWSDRRTRATLGGPGGGPTERPRCSAVLWLDGVSGAAVERRWWRRWGWWWWWWWMARQLEQAPGSRHRCVYCCALSSFSRRALTLTRSRARCWNGSATRFGSGLCTSSLARSPRAEPAAGLKTGTPTEVWQGGWSWKNRWKQVPARLDMEASGLEALLTARGDPTGAGARHGRGRRTPRERTACSRPETRSCWPWRRSTGPDYCHTI